MGEGEVAVLTAEVDEEEEAIEKKRTYVTIALIPCKNRIIEFVFKLTFHGSRHFIYRRVCYIFKFKYNSDMSHI